MMECWVDTYIKSKLLGGRLSVSLLPHGCPGGTPASRQPSRENRCVQSDASGRQEMASCDKRPVSKGGGKLQDYHHIFQICAFSLRGSQYQSKTDWKKLVTVNFFLRCQLIKSLLKARRINHRKGWGEPCRFSTFMLLGGLHHKFGSQVFTTWRNKNTIKTTSATSFKSSGFKKSLRLDVATQQSVLLANPSLARSLKHVAPR